MLVTFPAFGVSGPPPRTRGTRQVADLLSWHSGTTPAYAGNATRSTPRMFAAPGPPPRTRGTREERGQAAGVPGTTPAYAGNAVGAEAAEHRLGDHPRVRGERRDPCFVPASLDGPPPRTRGTRPGRRCSRTRHGTTPAYAGNAPAGQPRSGRSRDHPRVRGERASRSVHGMVWSGPPPRTRGTQGEPQLEVGGGGTTPAYAGNAFRPPSASCGSWDHPRVRGERLSFEDGDPRSLGPPPRTRGTRVRGGSWGSGLGTTPAYAGNATGRCRSCGRLRDHPRVRGERSMIDRPRMRREGPPPRTRGTRGSAAHVPTHPGTTPAYAGNAPDRAAHHSSCRDHPRVRGERSSTARRSASSTGPPPRTRGTRHSDKPKQAEQGTTPAYAGNASAHRRRGTTTTDHPRVAGQHVGQAPAAIAGTDQVHLRPACVAQHH